MTKKKILFVSQYFYPETFRGNDIAFYLAKQGHDIHVVSGTPNYPSGRYYKGYGIFSRNHEVIDGVHVTRLPIIPRGNNKIMLMLNYFSYFIVSCIYILFHSLFNKYDLVFCQQLSPIMMSAPAVLYKKIRRVPLYTWVLDLWPESLTAAGGINNKYVLSFFKKFVSSEYRNSDKILISSKNFIKSVCDYGNYDNKVVYYPQWSDGESKNNESRSIHDILKQNNIEGSSIFNNGNFIVMFAGAIGEAHGFDCNMQAALLTKDHKNIKWVIVGDGRKLEWVNRFISENKLTETVHTLGRYPADTMPLFFEKASVMLVSLADSPLFNLYAPAKISSYMAASKPIIACLNGEGGDVVKDANCGWCVRAGDAQSLAELVINLSLESSANLAQLGKNGKNYYDEHFEKEKCLHRLNTILRLD